MDKATAVKRLNYLIDTEEALCLVPQEQCRNYEYMHRHPEAFNQYHPYFAEIQELLKIIIES